MALAHWAHKELDRGVQPDEIIRQVVEGHESWAVLALSVTLALEEEHASATTLPIASAQRLWRMDMARVAQVPMQGIDPLGLGELVRLTGDKEDAMEYLKSRRSRRVDIRSLAPLFALSPDEELRRAYRDRLARFPNDLPFDYEEERSNSSQEAALREDAQQWVGLGEASNYRASRTPDSEKVMIEYEPPIALSDPRRESLEQTQASLGDFGIAGWARKSLEEGAPDASSSLETALTFVMGRDKPTLFDHLTPAGGGMTQSAVSGVAACALLLGPATPEDEAWAWDVMRRVETVRRRAIATPPPEQHTGVNTVAPRHRRGRLPAAVALIDDAPSLRLAAPPPWRFHPTRPRPRLLPRLRHLRSCSLDRRAPRRCPFPIAHVRSIPSTREGGTHRISDSR